MLLTVAQRCIRGNLDREASSLHCKPLTSNDLQSWNEPNSSFRQHLFAVWGILLLGFGN